MWARLGAAALTAALLGFAGAGAAQAVEPERLGTAANDPGVGTVGGRAGKTPRGEGPGCSKEWVARYAMLTGTGLFCGGLAVGSGPAGPVVGPACSLAIWPGQQFVDYSGACQ